MLWLESGHSIILTSSYTYQYYRGHFLFNVLGHLATNRKAVQQHQKHTSPPASASSRWIPRKGGLPSAVKAPPTNWALASCFILPPTPQFSPTCVTRLSLHQAQASFPKTQPPITARTLYHSLAVRLPPQKSPPMTSIVSALLKGLVWGPL